MLVKLLISILPILVYLLIIKGVDGFALIRWRRLFKCMHWGLTACLICFVAGHFTNDGSGILFPLVEETVKFLPFLYYVGKKRIAFLTESVVYGAAAGAGFSFGENILYVVLSEEFTLGDAILRGFGTALLHMGCTVLLASMVMLASRLAAERKPAFRIAAELLCVFPSWAIHALYNKFLLPEFVQLLLTVVVIFLLIYLFFFVDQRHITRWMDLCINNDIALYKAIREGHLRETRAGQYLLAVKEKFQPEVFFDICVYLGLYLELTIAAKSRMLIKGAGLEVELSEEEKAADRARYLEFLSLRSSIGPTGIYILRPIVREKAIDEWTVKELI